ncbi:trimethylamine methyltransferase family protein [candidate division KSB1 bacterium]|nr:trimethylamine methyltransferase family protein [candidate division KSB1 bacterium]
MKPALAFLNEALIERIISEGIDILCKLGVEVHNENVLSLLSDFGAQVDKVKQHVIFKPDLIEKSLRTAAHPFKLFDVLGNETHFFTDDNVYFTPGSAAIHLLDYDRKETRRPDTRDYIAYAKIISQLEHIASQSTAFIPADVPDAISDSYRLFLSLLYCEKPVVTGTFTLDSFAVMRDFQVAVRGSAHNLKEKPLTIFSACPTSPLKWSAVTSQSVVDCALHGIPVEFIAMPLSGFMAPVSKVGTLVQHTAETLSGIVISQLASPGAPVLYGGSPAIFDLRYETTPMGAIETMMIDCGYNEIGKRLGIPTQAYISLSDAKMLDAQAGLESGIGAALAVLSGINNIAGPGMLNFENCQSLEKLVLDNEICGMTLQLVKGIEPKEDLPTLPLLQELLAEGHLLIADHTQRYLREEIFFPGPIIDRANASRWRDEGAKTLVERAHAVVNDLVERYRPSRLSDDVKNEMIELMEGEARRYGQDHLPPRQDDSI